MAEQRTVFCAADFKYVVRFFDDEWTEVPNTAIETLDVRNVTLLLQGWRRARAVSAGLNLESLSSYQRAVCVGIELVYGS